MGTKNAAVSLYPFSGESVTLDAVVHRGSWPRRAMSSSLERAFLPARGTSPTFPVPSRLAFSSKRGPPGSWLERSDLCLVTFLPQSSHLSNRVSRTYRQFSWIGRAQNKELKAFGVRSYVSRGGEARVVGSFLPEALVHRQSQG